MDIYDVFKDKREVYSFVEEIKLDSNSFLNQEIISKETIDPLIAFAYEKLWFNNASVNVFDVIGSAHPDYAGKTWENLIQNGRRMNENIELLIKNPIYYLEEIKKDPTMYYIQIENDLFIGDDGNHRTALAKLLFTKIKQFRISGVDLVHYQINYNLKKAYEDLLKSIIGLPFQASLLSTKIAREDGEGWMKEKFSLAVKVINIYSKKEVILSDSNLISLLAEEIRGMKFFKRFLKTTFRDFIYRR